MTAVDHQLLLMAAVLRVNWKVSCSRLDRNRSGYRREAVFYFVAKEQSGQLSLLVMAVTSSSHEGDNLKGLSGGDSTWMRSRSA